MCGHVGLAGNLAFKDEATVKRLLMLDYFRGPDSTGLASIRADSVEIAKIASHPIDLFETRRFAKALSGFASRAFIGHNRAATKGVVSNENAHPYEFGHIVGAHNGTLSWESHKALEKLAEESFDVDSKAIFACIEKVGIEETAKHLQGAWALVWYDFKKDTINFLRNKERTFFYAYDKEFERVFWASEWWMIDSACRLSQTGYDIYMDDKGNRYWATEVDTLYSYDLSDFMSVKSSTIPKPLCKMIKGKEPAPVVSTVSNGNFPTRNGTTNSGSGTTRNLSPTGLTTHSRGNASPIQVLHLVGDADDPYAGMLKREKFDALAKYGCSYCSASIEWGDLGITIHERDHIIRCQDCSTGSEDTVRIHVSDAQVIANLM